MGDTNELPTVLALCAGYAGIERGLDLAGVEHRVLAYVEIEAYAIANLVKRWNREPFNQHLFGRTLKPSRGTYFEEKLKYYVAAIHVSHFQRPGCALAATIQDTCGHLSTTELASSILAAYFLKTSKDTSRLDSPQSSAIWKNEVMTRRLEYSARLKSAHRTSESECTLWQTPVADDAPQRLRGKINSRGEPKLPAQVLLPTPTATPYGSNQGGAAGRTGKVRESLETMARNETWPTPTTSPALSASMEANIKEAARLHPRGQDHLAARMASRMYPTPGASDGDKGIRTTAGAINEVARWKGACLSAHVIAKETWPTPAARDYRSDRASKEYSDKREEHPRGKTLAWKVTNGTDPKHGALNPDWVELLMGLPPGWTDVTAESIGDVRPWDENWESCVPRVTNIQNNRVDRIRLLGNGVVPQTAAKAWQVLDDQLSNPNRKHREHQIDFGF